MLAISNQSLCDQFHASQLYLNCIKMPRKFQPSYILYSEGSPLKRSYIFYKNCGTDFIWYSKIQKLKVTFTYRFNSSNNYWIWYMLESFETNNNVSRVKCIKEILDAIAYNFEVIKLTISLFAISKKSFRISIPK